MNRALAPLLAIALVSSCQRGQDRAAETIVEKIIETKGRESDVEIDRERGSIRVTLGGAVKPDGWPAAVPIYPHAERAKIEKTEAGAGASQRLSVLTADSVAELRDYYRQALTKADWQIAGEGAADAPDMQWIARRGEHGEEGLEVRFAERGRGKGSRVDIDYRKRS